MIQTFESRIFNLVKEAVLLEFNVSIGASGATSALKGGGITSIAKIATGIYKITLDRRYNRLFGVQAGVIPAVTGAAVNDGSLVAGTVYRIVTVGNSDFTSAGADENTVGTVFAATGAGGSGTGTVKELAVGNVVDVQLSSANLDTVQVLVVSCVDKDGALVEPASGSVLFGTILLRKSSVKGQGE